jgi:hypothetical protein
VGVQKSKKKAEVKGQSLGEKTIKVTGISSITAGWQTLSGAKDSLSEL